VKRIIYKIILIFCLGSSFFDIFSLKIDRVILSSDLNPMYLDFWPIVAKVWHHVLGIKPTLALMAPANTLVDTSIGDVIRFDPIPGLPISAQAQVIRLLVPAFFEDDICLIADIDMIPLSKNYFTNTIADYPENAFIVFKDRAYDSKASQYPMCYNVARGSTFKEVFNIKQINDIPLMLREIVEYGYGWCTDEIHLYKCLNNWSEKSSRLIKLGHGVEARIDRSKWNYNIDKIYKGEYVDAHMVRPYKQYMSQIDNLIRIVLSRQW
jgi:hypothetical protein